MKRKEFRQRMPVLISVERDRWNDFRDLCDHERKTTSLMLDEVIAKLLEGQKNEDGEATPINITYGIPQDKSSFIGGTLDPWLSRDTAIQKSKEVPDMELDKLVTASSNLWIAYRFRTEGIITV